MPFTTTGERVRKMTPVVPRPRRALTATALALVAALLCSVVTMPAASAGLGGPIVLFAARDWTRRNGVSVKALSGVQVRTRGSFPDTCVLAPVPCFTQPESTATTHVIRELVRRTRRIRTWWMEPIQLVPS